MPTLLKKFILSFLSFLVLFVSIAPNFSIAKAQAQGSWYNQDFKTWLGKVDDTSNPNDIFGERYTSAQVQWVIYGLFAFILRSATNAETLSCLFTNSANVGSCTGAIQSLLTSVTPQNQNLATKQENTSLLSMIFADRPISGVGYIKNKIQNFSLVPVAHAQTVGFGFSALEPIQGIWSAMRNVAFGLFVLAAVIFAFMIMFRVKISPQVVISVQSAIPKLIISLVLVTFSYAIAGFLIDLMYVVIGLLSVIAASFMPSILGGTFEIKAIFSLLTQGNILGAVNINLSTGFLGIFSMIFTYLTPLIVVLLILTVVVAVATGGLLFWIPLALAIIVAIIGIWMSIKTVWALLKAFANIILLTVFAPIQIVAGTVMPNFGFGQWVKSYVSHLSVFVVTGVLYLFSIIFLGLGIQTGLSNVGGGLISSLLGPLFGPISVAARTFSSSFPPMLGSGTQEGYGLLLIGVSFVLFTMIPKATELVQALLSGKPFAYGSAIGEALGPEWLRKGVGGYASQAGIEYGAGRLAGAIEASGYGDRGVAKLFLDFLKSGQKPQKGGGGVISPGERRT